MGEMQQFGLLADWTTEGTYRTMGEFPTPPRMNLLNDQARS
jgi:hypothetical protein